MTILARATPPAPGGVGILRLSGPHALEAGLALAPDVPASPEPRRAYFTRFVDRAGRALDEGLFLFFKAPHSYTGEDVVELQAHGSPRLLTLLQKELLVDPRLRAASPGEFTRRAFLSGRLDLARAEAVADLVAADSEAAVRGAAAQLRGGLSRALEEVRRPLAELRADVEGVLGFPDEAEDADAALPERLSEVFDGVARLLATARQGRLVRSGARVVLFGPVNAGKSTLFNCLLGEARALVDDEPGTTRDVLEARLELQGLSVTLLDTAGLREEPGRLEALGIQRAREALAGADLAVLVVPPETSAEDLARWSAGAGEAPLLLVRSKSDLGAFHVKHLPGAPAGRTLHASGRTGEGVEALRAAMMRELWGSGAPEGQRVTSERHVELLRRAHTALAQALEAARGSTLEVVAGELGLADEALGDILGIDASEALLDEVFRRFCIGK